MRRRKLERKVVVVTGASSGVGRAIVRLFGAEGARVALLARDLIELEDVASEIRSTGGEAMVLPLDMTDAAAVEAAADRVAALWGEIDFWVNDAMVSIVAPGTEISPAEYRRVIEVNYLGYVYGTLAALKHMRPRNMGVIVQIGSAVASRALPLQSAYAPSKAAIRGFTDALRGDLIRERSAIHLTHLQLPAVNTPAPPVAGSERSAPARPALDVSRPEVIAAVALRAVLRPRRAVWTRWSTMRAILRQRLVPRFLDRTAAPAKGRRQEPRRRPAENRVRSLLGRTTERLGGRRGILTRGLVAGLVGTLVIALSGVVERVMLRRAPVYAPRRLVRRLFRAHGHRLPRYPGLLGGVMRWTYGPLVGVVYSATLRRAVRRRWPAAPLWPMALVLGGVVYLFEVLALPTSGATQRLARWPRTELALLAGHTALFGVATEATDRSLEPA